MAFVIPSIFTAVDKFSAPVKAMTGTVEAFASRASAGLLRGERAFHGIKKGADEAFEKVVNIKNAIAGIVIGETAKKIFEFAENTSKAGDAAAKTSKRLGLTAEALQELKFAAGREGVGGEMFVSAMEAMNNAMGKLHAKSGKLYSILQKTNPALAKQLSHAKNNEQAFNLITKSINKLPNEFQKAALSQAAFGGSGARMLSLVSKGTVGINALREEARKYGGVISNEAAAAAEDFNDAQENMEFAISGVKNTLGSALMPVIQGYMEQLTTWIGNNKELIKVKVQYYVEKLAKVLGFLIDNLDKIIFVTKLFVGALVAAKAISIATAFAINGLKVATYALRGITILATAAQWLLNAAMSANPISLLIIAIAALVAGVILAIKYWQEWGAAATALFALINWPLALIISLVQSFRRNWEMITEAFKNGGILSGLKAIGKTLLDVVLMPLQQIVSLVAKFTGWDWATNATKNIEKFRKDLGVNVTTDESGDPLPGKKVIDNNTAARKAAVEKYEQTNNANVGLTIDNRSGHNVNVNNPGGVKINIGSTFPSNRRSIQSN